MGRPERGRRSWGGWAAAGAALLGLGLVARAVWVAQALPTGPEPVAWDRVSCARCRMLVSEPRFAAQLHTREGSVLYFDDPSCLLLFEREQQPDVRAAWFRHLDENRWIPWEEAVFVPIDPTPMGYGLGASDRGTPGGLSAERALEWALRREATRRGS